MVEDSEYTKEVSDVIKNQIPFIHNDYELNVIRYFRNEAFGL